MGEVSAPVRRALSGADSGPLYIKYRGWVGGGLLSVALAVGSIGCKSEDTSGGIAPDPELQSRAALVPLSISSEPALSLRLDSASKKLFIQGIRAFRQHDHSTAASLFHEAQENRQLRSASLEGDEFMNGCEYYLGRANEGLFQFDTAKIHYDRVPAASAYRPYAAARLVALDRDSDADGYSDAWEEAESTNPQNPLSHP